MTIVSLQLLYSLSEVLKLRNSEHNLIKWQLTFSIYYVVLCLCLFVVNFFKIIKDACRESYSLILLSIHGIVYSRFLNAITKVHSAYSKLLKHNQHYATFVHWKA